MNANIQSIVVNMCDERSLHPQLDIEEYLLHINELLDKNHLPFEWEITGIRIGAETCGRLFSALDPQKLEQLCRQAFTKKLAVSFVVPVLEQSCWETGIQTAEAMMETKMLHTFVINDFGVLKMLKERRQKGGWIPRELLLGRLFDKRFRDPRFEANAAFHEENTLMSEEWRSLCQKESISGIECECIGENFPFREPGLTYYVHMPYTLISTGQICEFSGIGLTDPDRFKLHDCHHQCLGLIARARHNALKKPIYKHGNSLYMSTAFTEDILHTLSAPNVKLIFTEFA